MQGRVKEAMAMLKGVQENGANLTENQPPQQALHQQRFCLAEETSVSPTDMSLFSTQSCLQHNCLKRVNVSCCGGAMDLTENLPEEPPQQALHQQRLSTLAEETSVSPTDMSLFSTQSCLQHKQSYLQRSEDKKKEGVSFFQLYSSIAMLFR